MQAVGCHFVTLSAHDIGSEDVVSGLAEGFEGQAAPQTVVVVRPVFAEDGGPPLDLETTFKCFPGGYVAVKASISRGEGTLLCEVYTKDGAKRAPKKAKGAAAPKPTYSLEESCVELCTFLTSRGALLFLAEHVSAAVPPPSPLPQSTHRVVMVAPTAFTSNAEAAQDNKFMHGASGSVTAQVLREFSGLHRVLTEHAGVQVTLFTHSLKHDTPDAVFPNNWFSTELSKDEKERMLVLYPLKCHNRQRERRPDIIEAVKRLGGFSTVLDLTANEKGENPRYLEGTGCIVMDRPGGVAFCAVSERCSEALAREWAEQVGGMRVVAFRTRDVRGFPIYHTNVLMAVGTGFAVVCLECIPDAAERAAVVEALKGKEIVEISLAQMGAFCGNVLELRDRRGLPVLAASSQAAAAFTPEQTAALLHHVAAIYHAPVETLERVGGGGVRCTLAEVFGNTDSGGAAAFCSEGA